ncbi:MAG: phosphatase PAP2-related protein, partial [Candidatus Woesearchaeota archaeon]|nr:phosphatase PAP2-related protein [Candidatus Woesearchaeota archaeon]
SKTPGVVAPDIILDHTPTFDLDIIFIYGFILIVALIFIYPLFFRIKELHRVISQFSLLVMVRAAFTTLTHLQIPSSALVFTVPRIISFITFQNDLFFSGHTAVAFLGFLLFKTQKIRYFFLAASIMMGVVVLLMHVHYTIDVLSAFFITYGTFKIGEHIFRRMNHY